MLDNGQAFAHTSAPNFTVSRWRQNVLEVRRPELTECAAFLTKSCGQQSLHVDNGIVASRNATTDLRYIWRRDRVRFSNETRNCRCRVEFVSAGLLPASHLRELSELLRGLILSLSHLRSTTLPLCWPSTSEAMHSFSWSDSVLNPALLGSSQVVPQPPLSRLLRRICFSFLVLSTRSFRGNFSLKVRGKSSLQILFSFQRPRLPTTPSDGLSFSGFVSRRLEAPMSHAARFHNSA